MGKAEIGVHDAHQCEAWEMVALGHELGPDNDVHLAVLDFPQRLAQIGDARGEIARHDGPACLGKARRHFLGDALDPWAAGNK